MLPLHAIPFLIGPDMPTVNMQLAKNTHLNHLTAPMEPYSQSKWVYVSQLLKFFSGASPKAPKGSQIGVYK